MERKQSESQDEAENVILAELNSGTGCPPGEVPMQVRDPFTGVVTTVCVRLS